MRHGIEISGSLASGFLEADPDLREHCPDRPRLIEELVLLPYGQDDIIVLGLDVPRQIKCDGSRRQLLQLLRYLDGTKTWEEIRPVLSSDEAEQLWKVIALLYRYGMIEDGMEGKIPKNAGTFAAYIGRHINSTRFHRDRYAALEELGACRLVLNLPGCAKEEIALMLGESGVREAFFFDGASEKVGDFTFAVAIDDGSSEEEALLRMAYERRIPCLHACIGASEVRVGPLIVPGITASHHCARRQASDLSPNENPDELLFWSAFAVQEALNIVAGISIKTYINQYVAYKTGSYSAYPATVSLARLPGGPASGLENAGQMNLKSSGFQAWRHHCGVRFPPKQFLAPKIHQYHYAGKNIAAANAPGVEEYGTVAVLLPEKWSIPENLPWITPAAPQRQAMNQESLGNLLRAAVGNQRIDTLERRISPTGGNLKSVNFLLRLKDAAILDGWYLYDAARHALRHLKFLDRDELDGVLGMVGEEAACLVVVISDLHKVRQKYGDFAYNIVHLDAGIATAYADVMTRSYGWSLRHFPQADNARIGRALQVSQEGERRIVSNIFAIETSEEGSQAGLFFNGPLQDLVRESWVLADEFGERPLASEIPDGGILSEKSAGRTLEEVFRSRRSGPGFGERTIAPDLLEDLILVGLRAKMRMTQNGMCALPVSIFVLVLQGDKALPNGIYEASLQAIGQWKQRPFSRAQFGRCVNQNVFCKASVFLAWVADLERILGRYGAPGYRMLLNQCGAMSGEIWLAAHAAGLAARPCGGRCPRDRRRS